MKRLWQQILTLMLLLLAVPLQAQEQADSTAERQRAVDYLYMHAQSLLEQGKVDEAYEIIEHCCAMDTLSPVLQYTLANFYLLLDKDSLAIDMLEDIVKADPNNEIYSDALVAYYRKLGDIESAIALYESRLATSASKSNIYMALFTLYKENGDELKALQAIEALEKLEGELLDLTIHKLQQNMLLGKSAESIAIVEKLIAENPDDHNFVSLLGDTYAILGEYKLAEEAYKNSLSLSPDNPEALSALSNLYLYLEDYPSYSNTLEALIKSEKTPLNERLSQLVEYIIYRESSDSTFARRFFDELMTLPFDQIELTRSYASYLESRRASKEEIKPLLKKIIALDPSDVDANIRLLSYAGSENNAQEMLLYAENIEPYLPQNLTLKYYKALALYGLGRIDESIAVAKEGLSLREENTDPSTVADVFGFIGNAYYEQGMHDACMESYDSALVYNPSSWGVLNNYAYYLALDKKHLQQAHSMSRKTIIAEPENSTYLDTYAWVLFQMERYEEAKAYAEKMIALGHEMSYVVLHHCGDIFAKCGDIERAVEYWKMARLKGDESKILEKKIKKRKYYRD